MAVALFSVSGHGPPTFASSLGCLPSNAFQLSLCVQGHLPARSLRFASFVHITPGPACARLVAPRIGSTNE